MLPYKQEIGESPKLDEGIIYYQDFSRIKAVLYNNISTCFFKMGDLNQSDMFNDKALMEDPDYGKAHYRKCKILQKKG